jgi:hypothetical protein
VPFASARVKRQVCEWALNHCISSLGGKDLWLDVVEASCFSGALPEEAELAARALQVAKMCSASRSLVAAMLLRIACANKLHVEVAQLVHAWKRQRGGVDPVISRVLVRTVPNVELRPGLENLLAVPSSREEEVLEFVDAWACVRGVGDTEAMRGLHGGNFLRD